MNPFSSLGAVPVVQTIQQMMQRQADINNTQVKTDILGQQSQLIANQVASEKKFNDALSNLATVKQGQENAENSGLLSSIGNTEMGKPIAEGYKAESQSAAQNKQFAQMAIQAGDYAKYDDFQKRAEAAEDKARQWYSAGLKFAQDQRKELASAAGAYADDGSNLPDVIAAVKGIDPKELNGPQFNRDGKGNIVPGDKTTAAFSTIANKNMTRTDQLAAKREEDKIKQQIATNARADAREAREERRTDSLIAATQANLADKRADRAASREQDTSELASDGAMIATGMPLSQAIPGWGKSAVEKREAAKKEAISQIKQEMGVDDKQAGRELAQRQIDYVAGRRSTTQLNTMLGATRQAVSQLEFNVDQTKKILKDIPSTDLSPVINSLVRGEERWTGDPRYASLFFYMHAVAMESARILQGGQASIAQLHQGAAEEAKKWADIGLTPKMFDSVAKSILDEGNARIKTYQDAMKEQRVGGANVPAPAAAPVPAKDGGKVTDWSELK